MMSVPFCCALMLFVSFAAADPTRRLSQVQGPSDLPSAQCPSSPNDRNLELSEVSSACGE